jgi:tryptophan-rich sensory protein
MIAGRMFTVRGVTDWYPEILKPSFTPPGSVIGIIWTVIYILSAVSLILFVNRGREGPFFWPTIGIYVLNGIINAAWSYIFFTRHLIGLAVIDALLIALTVALMMVLAWPYSKASSLLLLPYFLWVSFASYLTYAIYLLN